MWTQCILFIFISSLSPSKGGIRSGVVVNLYNNRSADQPCIICVYYDIHVAEGEKRINICTYFPRCTNNLCCTTATLSIQFPSLIDLFSRRSSSRTHGQKYKHRTLARLRVFMFTAALVVLLSSPSVALIYRQPETRNNAPQIDKHGSKGTFICPTRLRRRRLRMLYTIPFGHRRG